MFSRIKQMALYVYVRRYHQSKENQ